MPAAPEATDGLDDEEEDGAGAGAPDEEVQVAAATTSTLASEPCGDAGTSSLSLQYVTL